MAEKVGSLIIQLRERMLRMERKQKVATRELIAKLEEEDLSREEKYLYLKITGNFDLADQFKPKEMK